MVLERLEGIVGSGNIVTCAEDLERYSALGSRDGIRPRCIVKVQDAAHVRQIVSIAKETGTPLIPVSSGYPHFHGCSAPAIGGAVIVDLSGLKSIIHIDRKNRAAMFEPGVTFAELIPALAREGLRLNMPLLPRLTKSVAGSMLEREPVVMPKYHWDIADPLACVEIIFGTGDMFRTGSAAGSGTIEEQWAAGGAQKEAAGPSSSSWYRIIQGAQGTMGIVTWVSARCELVPQVEEPYFIGSDRLDSLLDITHWLLRLRLVNECFILNNTDLAAILALGGDDFLHLRKSLPTWILFYNVAAYDYFPEERIRGQVEDIRDLTLRNSIVSEPALGGIDARSLLKTVQQPCEGTYWKLRRGGTFRDTFCVAEINDVPALVSAMEEAAEAAGRSGSDMGMYLQPMVQGVNWHCEFTQFYDHADKQETSRVDRVSRAAIDALVSCGGFFSRPYGEDAKRILNRDADTVMVLRKLKGIADPANIMNPGKLCF